MHEKVLKANIRLSYIRENTVCTYMNNLKQEILEKTVSFEYGNS